MSISMIKKCMVSMSMSMSIYMNMRMLRSMFINILTCMSINNKFYIFDYVLRLQKIKKVKLKNCKLIVFSIIVFSN